MDGGNMTLHEMEDEINVEDEEIQVNTNTNNIFNFSYF